MAVIVDIAIAGVSGISSGNSAMPVIDPIPVDTDVITSSGSSQQSDFAVPGSDGGRTGLFWVFTVYGGNVRVKLGDNPTAAAAEGGGWLILSGQTREFTALAGHKAAIITAEV